VPPVVIETRGVRKTFRIPHARVDSLKERVTHPRAGRGHRELHALRGIDLDVGEGEFFGIVGRNGSGKSTLLKILASIYRADAGTVRMAGRLAPFIELGVGFNPELTSRENVVLNGVLMGLTRREARSRLAHVLEFAELQDFADLKLKNYSSGMMVRLAFAVMVEADADIMLIDEVLAVGDASFAQKCMDVFRAKRAAGRTIVLVTHDMATVQGFCDRAMVLHDGEQLYVGDPEEAALRYFRLNFGGPGDRGPREGGVPDVNARLVEAWLEDPSGARVENVEQGDAITMHLVLEARQELGSPGVGLYFMNAGGAPVFGVNHEPGERLVAGERVHLTSRIENPLVPGKYGVNCFVTRNRDQGDVALHLLRVLDFVVYGANAAPGVVTVEATTTSEVVP
jgi:ABC-type polysaccharide/polyol phosphate transport system ATPase subunit